MNNWLRPKRSNILFAGYMLCIAAIAVSTIKLLRPGVKNTNDLYFFTAPLEDLKFTDGNRGYHNYRIWLEKYPNSFKINADFLSLFQGNDFKKIKPGKQLKIGIAKEDTLQLSDSRASIFLFSIADSNKTYLDATDAVRKFTNKRDYYLFGGIFVLGLLFLLAGYKTKKTFP